MSGGLFLTGEISRGKFKLGYIDGGSQHSIDISFCRGDGDCDSRQYCLLGFCVKKAAVGPCAADAMCISNHCSGICVECRVDSDCGNPNKFCGLFNCKDKWNDGTTCTIVMDDHACKSKLGCVFPGHCGGCKSDGDCRSDQFCDAGGGQCQTKWNDGHACVGAPDNHACKNGRCKWFQCGGCDRDSDCKSTEYCDAGGHRCQSKWDNGRTCVPGADNHACKSNNCWLLGCNCYTTPRVCVFKACVGGDEICRTPCCR